MNKKLQIPYKIGDKVVITNNLRNYIDDSAEMLHWIGKTMTIKSINVEESWVENYIKMEEDQWENGGRGWYWTKDVIDRLDDSFLDDYPIEEYRE